MPAQRPPPSRNAARSKRSALRGVGQHCPAALAHENAVWHSPRMRRAMRWLYCDPKSKMAIWSWLSFRKVLTGPAAVPLPAVAGAAITPALGDDTLRVVMHNNDRHRDGLQLLSQAPRIHHRPHIPQVTHVTMREKRLESSTNSHDLCRTRRSRQLGMKLGLSRV